MLASASKGARRSRLLDEQASPAKEVVVRRFVRVVEAAAPRSRRRRSIELIAPFRVTARNALREHGSYTLIVLAGESSKDFLLRIERIGLQFIVRRPAKIQRDAHG